MMVCQLSILVCGTLSALVLEPIVLFPQKHTMFLNQVLQQTAQQKAISFASQQPPFLSSNAKLFWKI